MQGMWRHSEADVLELMREGLTALSVLLGDQDFFTGSKPCAADAAAFAFLDKCASLSDCPPPCATSQGYQLPLL